MRRMLEEMLALEEARRPYAVATVIESRGSVPARPGAKMLVRDDGTQMGTVGGSELEQRIKAAAAGLLATGGMRVLDFELAGWKPGGLDSLCGGQVRVAVEAVLPPPHLLVAGGGHIGQALYGLATMLGWDVSIIDDRPSYVSAERFPAARERIEAPPAWFHDAPLPFTHLLLVGYAHCNDTDILRNTLPRFDGYVGVVASAAKQRLMWKALQGSGIRPEELARVECPVGLDIGAQTPAEIAIAIMARLIQRERGRGSPRLDGDTGQPQEVVRDARHA